MTTHHLNTTPRTATLRYRAWLRGLEANGTLLGRDRLGRFTRLTHVDQLRLEGGWVTDEAEVTHAHGRCASVHGEARSTETAEGWLCVRCIHVPVVDDSDTVGKSATMTCGTCGTDKRETAFPTAVDGGVRFRTTDECRKCRDSRTQAAAA
jgi:hypothetical protein